MKRNYYITVFSQSNETLVFSIKTSIFMKNNASPHLSRQTEKTCLVLLPKKKKSQLSNRKDMLKKIYIMMLKTEKVPSAD